MKKIFFFLLLCIPAGLFAQTKQYKAGKKAYDAENYRLAVMYFDSSLRGTPTDTMAFYYKGMAEWKTDYIDNRMHTEKGCGKAIESFNQMLELDPKNLDGLYNRAVAYYAKAQLTLLKSDYQQAMLDLETYKSISSDNFEVNILYKNIEAEYKDNADKLKSGGE